MTTASYATRSSTSPASGSCCCAERAAYWERTRTLLVADPHFGKAAAFRAAGVPGAARHDDRIARSGSTAALARTGATRIVFLGDFLHAREGREAETTRVVGEWRSRNAAVEMVLVRGNHDVRAGDPGPEIDIRCVDGAGRRSRRSCSRTSRRCRTTATSSAVTCIQACA